MDAAGIGPEEVARELGLSGSAVSHKLMGARAWFQDELEKLADILTGRGRFEITGDQLVRLVGKKLVKVRGYVG
jgi:hypothetical protein